MKSIFFTLLILLCSASLQAQNSLMDDHIKWSFSLEKIDETHANIVYQAKIVDGFHIFSLKHDPSKADYTGIIPEFKVRKNAKIKTLGGPFETMTAMKHLDGDWVSMYFEKKAIFKQKIEVLSTEEFNIDFDLYFQLCDENGCLPPFDLAGKVKAKGFLPIADGDTLKNDSSVENNVVKSSNTQMKQAEIKKEKPAKKESNWVIFIAGFLAGLVALITPCMFPMIPMTVTFFTKQSKTRKEGIFKALVYGVSIILIYVTFGVAFTAATGPLGLNDLSTNVWMNLLFFGIFVLFAFSFLGAFEIVLPSGLVNSVDAKSDKGGLMGVFFMAFFTFACFELFFS